MTQVDARGRTDTMDHAGLTVGARVRSTMDIGGIIRPFVPHGTIGVVDALLDPAGHLVRFDADGRAVAVHADEIVEHVDASSAR